MVSLTGSRGHDSGVTGLQARDHPGDQRRRRERPGGVVHEHELRVADGGQRETNRLGAIGPACHDDRVTAEDELGLVGAVGRHGYHDAVDDAGVTQTAKGVLEHRTTGEVDECLRRAGRQPFP